MNKGLSRKKFFTVFSILILLFVTPVFFAHYFYHHRGALPKHTTNRGTWVTPPVTLKQLNIAGADEIHGKWILLLMHPEPCDEACMKQLEVMARIQRALGKDMNRLQRVTLIHPETVWMVGDPSSNLILRYRADQNPEDILDDLKHLIEASNHG